MARRKVAGNGQAAASVRQRAVSTAAQEMLGKIEESIRDNWRTACPAMWQVAHDLRFCRQQELWRGEHLSWKQWIESTFKEVISFQTASHLVKALDAVMLLPKAEQPKWMAISPYTVYGMRQVIAADHKKALTAATGDSVTRKSAIQAASEAAHLDTEYRTIKLTVSLPVYEVWVRAVNRARYEAHKASPTDTDIVEFMATTVLNEPLDPEQSRFTQDEIEAGLAVCRECGSLDARKLELHHVIPRSHGGHEGPLVPLCMECHEAIGPKWREWAIGHGYLQAATAP